MWLLLKFSPESKRKVRSLYINWILFLFSKNLLSFREDIWIYLQKEVCENRCWRGPYLYNVQDICFQVWHFSWRSYPTPWNFKNKANWKESPNHTPRSPFELYVFWFFGSTKNTLVNLLKKGHFCAFIGDIFELFFFAGGGGCFTTRFHLFCSSVGFKLGKISYPTSHYIVRFSLHPSNITPQ